MSTATTTGEGASGNLPSAEAAGGSPDATNGDGSALAVPVAIASAPGESRGQFPLALALAALAHGLLIAFLIPGPALRALGGGGEELEAIEIDVVAADQLEATRAAAMPGAAQPAPAVDAAAGVPTPSSSEAEAPAVERERERPPEPSEPPPRVEFVAPRPEPVPDEVAELVMAPEPELTVAAPALPREEAPARTETAPAPPATPAVAADGSAKGGSDARGTASFDVAGRGTAATAGLVKEYGRQVLVALARNKPVATAGQRGTVRVSFAVTRAGTPADVRVVRSSGRSEIDRAALDAVARTRFPPPPVRLGVADLLYELPYHFR
jgi:protein TonB